MTTISDTIQSAKDGTVNILDNIKSYLSTSGIENAELFRIGRPCSFAETIDKNHRVGRYLKSKMNIIDILPCSFKLDLNKFAQNSADDDTNTGLLPTISYSETIEMYKTQCLNYGLEQSYDGLRIYTTDGTSATDNISNELRSNFFEDSINKFSEFGRSFTGMLSSSGLGTEASTNIRKSAESTLNTALNSGIAKSLGSNISKITGATAANMGGTVLSKTLKTAISEVVQGNRVSLPQIWSNTSYKPNFMATIKLVSPYGHPRAIKEFIIKPLMYLLILSSPRSTDGISYGKPYFLTIQSYGLSSIPVGIISNISLRRGGNDTSFNIYRQPLSIDVTLDFSWATNGFACYAGDSGHSSTSIFPNADSFLYGKNTDIESSSASMPLLENIVQSLKPVIPESNINGYSYMLPFRNTKNDVLKNESTPISSSSNKKTDISDIKQHIEMEQTNINAINQDAKDSIKKINIEDMSSSVKNNGVFDESLSNLDFDDIFT